MWGLSLDSQKLKIDPRGHIEALCERQNQSTITVVNFLDRVFRNSHKHHFAQNFELGLSGNGAILLTDWSAVECCLHLYITGFNQDNGPAPQHDPEICLYTKSNVAKFKEVCDMLAPYNMKITTPEIEDLWALLD